MLTLFGYVLKNLGRQKLRTLLSAFGVMLGVWLVVIFTAVSAGALAMQEAMLTEFGEDFHCYKKGVADPFLSTLADTKTRDALRSIEGIESTSSVLMWFAVTRGKSGAFMLGLRPGEFALERLLANGEGGFSGPAASEAILGGRIRERLGHSIGDEIEIEGTRLRVVGTYLTGKPLYDNAILLPLGMMQEMFRGGADVCSFFAVRVLDDAKAVDVAERVEAQIPVLSTVRTMDDLAKVDQGVEKMQTLSYVITFLAVFLGWLFVTLAMVMVVFERTRELGILRAVGWKKRHIVSVILLEAGILAVIGAVVGIPSGLGLVDLISRLTELDNYLEPTWDIEVYVKAFLVALLAATTGALYPAWRAARLKPMEALRHE